ncbi:protein kinase domain-containing protein [Lusitaniella coriacea]|uniref:serine/threonine protein kinase n=1 Tax=Lusitaniella coriacea TaxID=1983105 RepID=UPI003CE77B19
MSRPNRLHCINPLCQSPCPQPGDNRFCQRCGTSLYLNGRYIPFGHLGTGGFAAIYEVWDLQQQEEKVLKVLTATSEKALQLFEQEASVLASLHHPGVPRVEPNSFFEVKTPAQSIYCLAMEKIVGHNLEEILSQHYPQGYPEDLVGDWLCQLVEILEVLHERKIVHRDIKPSNLMLRSRTSRDSGQLVLIDFGGAKQQNATQSSTRLFSSGYSPPEQIAGGGVESSADIYALGRTAIHLLTGKYPANFSEDMDTGQLLWRDGVLVGDALADLLDEMSNLNPAKRPQSAQDLHRRLARMPGMALNPTTAIARSISTFAQYSHRWGIQGYAIARQKFDRGWRISWKITKTIATITTNTTQEMAGSGLGAVFGTIIGSFLAFWTPLGWIFARAVLEDIPRLLPGIHIPVTPDILLFSCVGFGTGWGLAKVGNFNRRFPPIAVGLLSFCGYGMGWLLWQGMPYSVTDNFFALIATATTFLTLSLGLSNYPLLHTLLTTGGTIALFWFSIYRGVLPDSLIQDILSFKNFDLTLGFCSLLGMGSTFSLSVSYYIIIPFFQWLERP